MEKPIAPTPTDVAQIAQKAIDNIAEAMTILQSRQTSNSHYFYSSEDFKLINATLDCALEAQNKLKNLKMSGTDEKSTFTAELRLAISVQAELALILTLFLREIKEHYKNG